MNTTVRTIKRIKHTKHDIQFLNQDK